MQQRLRHEGETFNEDQARNRHSHPCDAGLDEWPYYALYDFANGMHQSDQVALERRVAWDSVRQGLRDDLNGAFLQSPSKNDSALLTSDIAPFQRTHQSLGSL